MIKLISVLLFTSLVVSIYTKTYMDVDGNAKSMSSYQNKKILIVNTATGSQYAPQFTQLEQLYQQHKDSLVVIAFPNNSFGNEPGSNSSIKSIMQNTYGITFPIAAKSIVTGDSANSVFNWLQRSAENGVFNTVTKGDFQKFLLDRQGNLVAVFDTATSPIDPVVQLAIHEN